MIDAPIPIATLQKTAAVQVRIGLESYKGHDLCQVREYAAFTAAKVPMPTPKGIALPVRLLPEVIAALQVAETEARRLGLIEGGAA